MQTRHRQPTSSSLNAHPRVRLCAALRTTLAAAICLTAMPTPAPAKDRSPASIDPGRAKAAVMDLLPPIPADSAVAAEDYVSVNGGSDSRPSVQVRIEPDGRMMPSWDWQKAHLKHCKKQARYTGLPSEILDFAMDVNAVTCTGATSTAGNGTAACVSSHGHGPD